MDAFRIIWLSIFTIGSMCFSIVTAGSYHSNYPNLNGIPRLPHRKFISFSTRDKKIDINFDVSLPFLTISLEPPSSSDAKADSSLIDVHLRSVTLAGALIGIATFVLPLFEHKPNKFGGVHPPPENPEYRTTHGLDLVEMGDKLNNILLNDMRIAPCFQRAVCTATTMTKNANNPSSVDKIVDGFLNQTWFDSAMNGSVIADAVRRGREAHGAEDCTGFYKGCKLVSNHMIRNMMKVIDL